MPSVSKKQARFMAAASHNPKFAKKVGIKQSVAKDFNRADAGTGILKKAMGGLAAAQQPMQGAPARSRPAPKGRKSPKSNMRKPRKPVSDALRSADQTINQTGGQLSDLAAGAPAGDPGALGYAEGGKVGAATMALRALAAKYQNALEMQDTVAANRIKRQMEMAQPGASELAVRSANAPIEQVAADKLATFAKGGKVGAASKLAAQRLKNAPRKTTQLEFVRSVPDHEGDFDYTVDKPWSKDEMHGNIGDYLEEAGHPRELAKHFKVTKGPDFIEFDSGNPTHAGAYFGTHVEGPDHLVDAIDKVNNPED